MSHATCLSRHAGLSPEFTDSGAILDSGSRWSVATLAAEVEITTSSTSQQYAKAMNPDRYTWRLTCLAVMAAWWASCVFGPEPSIAADQERSAVVEQAAERLACLDAMANPKGQDAPTEASSDERSLIITRCLSQTGEFGSAMARACAKQDLAAYEALLAYPEACAPFVVHCAKRLGQHGWGMVKICVDKDIEAERPSAD